MQNQIFKLTTAIVSVGISVIRICFGFRYSDFGFWIFIEIPDLSMVIPLARPNLFGLLKNGNATDMVRTVGLQNQHARGQNILDRSVAD